MKTLTLSVSLLFSIFCFSQNNIKIDYANEIFLFSNKSIAPLEKQQIIIKQSPGFVKATSIIEFKQTSSQSSFKADSLIFVFKPADKNINPENYLSLYILTQKNNCRIQELGFYNYFNEFKPYDLKKIKLKFSLQDELFYFSIDEKIAPGEYFFRIKDFDYAYLFSIK